VEESLSMDLTRRQMLYLGGGVRPEFWPVEESRDIRHARPPSRARDCGPTSSRSALSRDAVFAPSGLGADRRAAVD
jgi:hypothetical protein